MASRLCSTRRPPPSSRSRRKLWQGRAHDTSAATLTLPMSASPVMSHRHHCPSSAGLQTAMELGSSLRMRHSSRGYCHGTE